MGNPCMTTDVNELRRKLGIPDRDARGNPVEIPKWAVKDLDRGMLPGIEFEGPMGAFWSPDQIPEQSLREAIRELVAEWNRRHPDQPIIGALDTPG